MTDVRQLKMVHVQNARKDIGLTKMEKTSSVQKLVLQICIHPSKRDGAYHVILDGLDVVLTKTSPVVRMNLLSVIHKLLQILLAKNNAQMDISETTAGAMSALTIA